MVWVAKRETLEIRGFYDAMILGSGDKLIFSSACGRYQDAAHAYRMNPRQREHYESWARPFHETVQGRVGYLEGDALHLWHGDLAYRFYSDRYDGFEKFLFDPYTDIARNGDGVWCWNSDKPELHTFARRFFERRWGKV
jgi:hypothetical protein